MDYTPTEVTQFLSIKNLYPVGVFPDVWVKEIKINCPGTHIHRITTSFISPRHYILYNIKKEKLVWDW